LRNDSFPNYTRLTTLILSYNRLEDIQLNAFAGLQVLRNIDLSYNNLKSVHPEIFSSNPVLESVSLRSNPLVYLPSESPILASDSVSTLDLSSCSLTTIHPLTFSSLPSLYSLDLSSNLLQTVSVSTLEKLPNLRILELANNRWTCNCDTVEVMQRARKRRGHHPAHRPVKCLGGGGQYRTLWTAASDGRSCNGSTTPAPLVVSEATNDTAASLVASEATTDIAATQTRLPFSLQIAPYSSLRMVIETAVKGGDEHTATPEIETGGWVGLFSWNSNTILVFLILPCTLGVAVFSALVAVNYFTKKWKISRPRRDTQSKNKNLAAFFSNEPLLDPQLTADLTKQHAGYVSIDNQLIPYDACHIYEEIV
jgi:hypothetical protein